MAIYENINRAPSYSFALKTDAGCLLNKQNFLVVALLGLSLFTEANMVIAEPQPLVLPEQGLVLLGQEKSQYMTQKTYSFFHPQENIQSEWICDF